MEVLKRYGVSLLLFLGLIASNSWTQYDRDRQFIQESAGDIINYVTIAEAAPGLPQVKMAFHHAQRWPLSYGLGLLQRLIPVPIYTLFRGCVIFMDLWVIFLFTLSLSRLGLNRSQCYLLVSMLIFNPYVFRYYLCLPGVINDVGFVLGLSLICWSLISSRSALILLGLLIAACSRQTALFLVVPIFFWWLWVERERFPSRRVPLIQWSLAISIPFMIYFLTSFVAHSFGLQSQNLSTLTGLFTWIKSEFSLKVLIEFILRWSIPYWIPILFLVGCLLSLFGGRGRFKVNREFFGLLLFWPILGSQPFLGGPSVTGQSGARLGALALVPFILAIGVFIRDFRLFETPREESIVIGALIALSSMHHIYSYNGSFSSEKAFEFALLQCVVAVVVGIVVFLSQKKLKLESI